MSKNFEETVLLKFKVIVAQDSSRKTLITAKSWSKILIYNSFHWIWSICGISGHLEIDKNCGTKAPGASVVCILSVLYDGSDMTQERKKPFFFVLASSL